MIFGFLALWTALICLANYLRGRGYLKFISERLMFPLVIAAGAFPIAYFQQLPEWYYFAGIVTIGLLNWSLWAWDHNGFLIFNKSDSRDYSQNKIILPIVGFITGYKQTTVLTPAQCQHWGFTFFTVRGTCLFPLFIALAFLYHSWLVLPYALAPIMQGVVYLESADHSAPVNYVRNSEIAYGVLMGFCIGCAALILLLK